MSSHIKISNIWNCWRLLLDKKLSANEITQIEKDTRTQSQGANFFKHRAGEIGASQSKQASQTDPALV